MKIAHLVKEGIKFTMAHDKGNKNGCDRLVKEISYYDKIKDEIITLRIDCDGSNGTDETVAGAINLSLEQIDAYLDDGEKWF